MTENIEIVAPVSDNDVALAQARAKKAMWSTVSTITLYVLFAIAVVLGASAHYQHQETMARIENQPVVVQVDR